MSEPLDRRLAAVMFADMVGFTALMQEDEHHGLTCSPGWRPSGMPSGPKRDCSTEYRGTAR